jgi:hypothetical protein
MVWMLSNNRALASWFCYLAGRNSSLDGTTGIAFALYGGYLSLLLRKGVLRRSLAYLGLASLYYLTLSRNSFAATSFFFSLRYLFSALSRYSRALRSYKLSLRFFGPPFFGPSPFFARDDFFLKTCLFIIYLFYKTFC